MSVVSVEYNGGKFYAFTNDVYKYKRKRNGTLETDVEITIPIGVFVFKGGDRFRIIACREQKTLTVINNLTGKSSDFTLNMTDNDYNSNVFYYNYAPGYDTVSNSEWVPTFEPDPNGIPTDTYPSVVGNAKSFMTNEPDSGSIISIPVRWRGLEDSFDIVVNKASDSST